MPARDEDLPTPRRRGRGGHARPLFTGNGHKAWIVVAHKRRKAQVWARGQVCEGLERMRASALPGTVPN